jgi:hypothetical protein
MNFFYCFLNLSTNSTTVPKCYFTFLPHCIMSREDKSQIVEQGDIFFFYRPKVGTEEVTSTEDVQRFYMVTAPDKRDSKYRLFVLGRKQLPQIAEGKSTPEERNWALNALNTNNPEDIRKELLAVEYETETRGKRRMEAAAPAGEGKYSIVKHDNHTELVYVLELPEIPGPTQKEFEIRKEASYIISVKNPDVIIPGFKAFEKRKPDYPANIKQKFGDRRWIPVEDIDLLNYENTQLLMIGARRKDVEEELGIELNEERETENTADLFKGLKVKSEQVPLKPLLKGEFPSKAEQPFQQEARHLSREEAPGQGGKVGGKAAASRAPSASAIAKILSGADFPMKKNDLIEYAQSNKTKVEAAEEVIQVIRGLPDKTYINMAVVEKAVGQVI